MRTIETTVYQFHELSDEAKEKAREWYRRESDDSDFSECVIYDAKECGRIIGIDIDKVYFSGFCLQGDGACFEGSYRYAKGGAKAIRAYAPQDAELHRIADTLQAIQRDNFYRLRANVEHSGHYYHEHCTRIEVEDCENQYRDIGDADKEVAESLRDFMRWIYRNLEKEYEYQNADEQVDEAITANGYEFTEEGEGAE